MLDKRACREELSKAGFPDDMIPLVEKMGIDWHALLKVCLQHGIKATVDVLHAMFQVLCLLLAISLPATGADLEPPAVLDEPPAVIGLCDCSAACTCGCNDGLPCGPRCGDVQPARVPESIRLLAPALSVPRSAPLPAFIVPLAPVFRSAPARARGC